MKLLQEGVFIGEIAFQSKLAMYEAERLKVASVSLDKLAIWSSIRSILTSAGNISKILWPVMKIKERGDTLREILNVDDDNILKDRRIRNFLEHYDERIDEYFSGQTPSVYRDLVMNPSLHYFGLVNCHRGYNSDNNTLVIRGETLDLNTVLNAIEKVKLNCDKWHIPVRLH